MESASRSEALTLQVQAARELDDFDKVVQTHWSSIFRFALSSVRDRDTAQIITQDRFLKAYRARESFRGDASVSTWLFQIAVNLIRDFGRSRRLQFWKQTRIPGQRRALESLFGVPVSGHGTPERAVEFRGIYSKPDA